MLESQIIIRFRKLLTKKMREKKIEFMFYKIPDFPGGPKRPFDAFLVVTGKFIAIEFKVKGNKPTKIQEYHLNNVNTCGGHSIVVDETNYKEYVKRIMRGAEITNRQIKTMDLG